MSFSCLIIDDEPLAREKLRRLLEREPDIEIVGECSHGAEALEAIVKHEPRLAFLDIQMPGMDGFEVLSKIPEKILPIVVFVTAHDRFALKAFEVHALDFLLKPFDEERFQSALARAREQAALRESSRAGERMASLLAELKGESSHPERLAVKSEGRIRLVRVKDILWIESADNYVKIHTRLEAHLMRETLQNLEKRLHPNEFLRISRSTIVNTAAVNELEPLFHGEYAVILHDGTRLTLTRSYKQALKQLLESHE